MKLDERKRLIEDKTSGVDALVDTILANPDSPESIAYQKTSDILGSSTKRTYLEACLLSSTEFERISELLEMELSVVRMYHDVYFDVSTFGKIDKLDHLANCQEAERNIKMWALHQGLDFIAWRLGHQVEISPVDGLSDLFTTCVYKSKEAMFSSNSSTASKEATKWVKLSSDIARLLKVWVMDSGAARKELEIAISRVTPSFDSLSKYMENPAEEEGSSEPATTDGSVGGQINAVFKSLESLKNE